MNAEQMKSALIEAVSAVYEAVVAAGPMGAPAGVVYAALMQQGCTLEQYEQIEGILIRSGLLMKKNDLLTAAHCG